MHLIIFREQKLGQVTAVLSGDACDQCLLHILQNCPLMSRILDSKHTIRLRNRPPQAIAVFNRLLDQKGFPEFPVVLVPGVAPKREATSVELKAAPGSHLKGEVKSFS